jgi:MFS family permease
MTADRRQPAVRAPEGGAAESRTAAVPPDASTAARQRSARILGFTSLCHFLNDGVVFFIPVVGDLLSQERHMSTLVVTAMLTTFYVVSATFGMAVGLVADAIGRRGTMMAVGIAILGVSLLGFYASLVSTGAPADVLVLVAAAVAGTGSSFYHPLGGSVLQLGYPARSRGRALGINGAAGSLGRALYPALFFVIAALGISKAATTIVFAVLSLLAAAIVAFGLPDEAGPAARAGRRVQAAPLRSLLSRSVVALMSISFLRSVAFIGVVSWVPIYLTTQRHAGLSTSLGWTVTVMYVGGIAGQPVFGLLADRFDKRFVLALDSLGSAVGIFLFLSTSGTGAAALLALAMFGLFTFSGFPLLLSLVADYVPKSSSTTGNALVWGVGSTGGQALGPLVVGLLTAGADANLGTAFGVLGGLAAATVLATPLLERTSRSTRVALLG